MVLENAGLSLVRRPRRRYNAGAMAETSYSLLERVRAQADSRGWRELVAVYEPLIRGWLRRQALQAADVDNLVQEVMAVLVSELPDFQHNGRPGAFRAWLRGITVNRLRELWRDQKRHAAPGGSDFEQVLDQLADDGSRLSMLWDQEHDRHVVHQLLKMIAADFEAKTWQAFAKVALQGKPASEVAAELGISEGAVWTAKSHVLKRLRQAAKDLLD
jgi:RNA polymerase sigma factor (sigma-70 family)